MKKLFLLLSGFGLFLLASPVQAAYFGQSSQNQSFTLNQTVNDDAFLAGQALSVTAPVNGELFIVGHTVSVNQSVGRSIFAAGTNLLIEHGSGYNTFAVGQSVILDGTFQHDVYVMAPTIILRPSTIIRGELHLSGSTVTLAGTINGNVVLDADSVNSSAAIGGSLTGTINHLAFTSGSIDKDLRYQSDNTATGLDKIHITGNTERTAPASYKRGHQPPMSPFHSLGFFISLLASLVIGGILIVLLGKKIPELYQHLNEHMASNFLRGLAIFFFTPIVTILLLFTLIGWKIALVMGAIYIVLILVTSILTPMYVGQWILKKVYPVRASSLVAQLLCGIVLIQVLELLPVLGILLRVALFFGLTLPFLGSLVSYSRRKA